MRDKLFAAIFIFLAASCFVSAQEGMWLPFMLQDNIEDMSAKGFMLDADDVYHTEKPSLKDAVIRIGGCTGVVVSEEGLVLTNHHCAYRAIQSHSTLESDYLGDGFWAMSKEEELPNPGLTATFLVRMEDVTERVLSHLDEEMTEDERREVIRRVSREIADEAVKDSRYRASVDSYYYGNEFYLSVYDVFEDVRLVGAPPSSIGKFGGDEDNWMWPRHTGDFTFFRIYAGEENEPASNDPGNKPYSPAVHATIASGSPNEGDFTMVYGFPGSTNQYLTSHAVRIIKDISNPHNIELRTRRLEAMESAMKESRKVMIQYAAKQSGVSNAWKRWQGENRGLDRLDAVERKRILEDQFVSWVSASPERESRYGHLIPRFEELYSELEELTMPYNYLREGLFAVEVLNFAGQFSDLSDLYNPGLDEEVMGRVRERIEAVKEGFFRDYHEPIDREVFAQMVSMYRENVETAFHPGFFKDIDNDYEGDIDAYTSYVFANSVFTCREDLSVMIDNISGEIEETVAVDPVFQILSDARDVYASVLPRYMEINSEINGLYRLYVEGLRKMQDERLFYPDANRTLRVSYGNVKGYNPRDAVFYNHYTTLSGVMEKFATGIDDYEVPENLTRLYENQDYGPYSAGGEMRVCFTASNHTTGGNSGSPVFNARGHLTGMNFDRVWEGTMSDIMFDPDQCRNISVDLSYIKFITDRFAGAGYLLDELTIAE